MQASQLAHVIPSQLTRFRTLRLTIARIYNWGNIIHRSPSFSLLLTSPSLHLQYSAMDRTIQPTTNATTSNTLTYITTKFFNCNVNLLTETIYRT